MSASLVAAVELFLAIPLLCLQGLFSATQTRQLRDLVRAGLRNPVFVRVQETQVCVVWCVRVCLCVIVALPQAAADLRMPAQLQNLYTVSGWLFL